MERSNSLTNQEWSQIETVLLDMDGTLLDLAFDNYFWLETIPQRYSEKNQLTKEQAQKVLSKLYRKHQGTLNWYCTDFWSQQLNLNIVEIKKQHSEEVAYRPGSLDFLKKCKRENKKVFLVTNAHPDTLSVKLKKIDFSPFFDELLCSHQLGFAKEQDQFWVEVKKRWKLNFSNTLFVDDSASIIARAKKSGVGFVCGINQPDLNKEIAEDLTYWAVNRLTEILPVSLN